MTVSNAFNRPDQISAVTRERVLRTAQELGYAGPSPAGRSLRRGHTGVIGVLLTEQLPYAFADPGSLMFLHGVATELAGAGHALLLLPSESNAEHGLVRNALVDGFVLVLVAPRDPVVQDVVARRLPAVSVGPQRIAGIPRIGVDNARASVAVARHLLELGHRRLAVVSFGGPLSSTRMGDRSSVGPEVRGVHYAMRQRVAGFVRVADEQSAEVVVVQAADHSRAAAARAVHDLLAQPARRRPTAVFGVTDVLALGVLDEAARLHIAVPGALSVAGFDDTADAAHSAPALTTVSQGLFDQGRCAARIVLQQIAGEHPAAPRVSTQLVVRDSTSQPPRST